MDILDNDFLTKNIMSQYDIKKLILHLTLLIIILLNMIGIV